MTYISWTEGISRADVKSLVNSTVSTTTQSITDSVTAYVDAEIEGIDTSIRTDVSSALNLKVNKSGDTLTGNLRVNANLGVNVDPLYSLHVNGSSYLQGSLAATGAVSADGGVFSGLLQSDNLLVNNSILADTVSAANSVIVGGVLTANAPITLNGGTVNSSTVDLSNRTNTYLHFGPAGATSDFAYLRQIGVSDSIQLALDFHDDLGGAFSLRNVQSGQNPDTIQEFFKVTRTRGFFSPQGIIFRTTSGTGADTSAILLNDQVGKFIVWVYGSNKLNSVVLPNHATTDVGTTIYVYNCTSQTLDVKVFGDAAKIYKDGTNASLTTLIQPQAAIFMFDGTNWLGCKMSISNF